MPTRTQQSDLLACAYASHGDTKHVLLFPRILTNASSTPRGIDLADRLQTPIFVMSDLDIGMNQRLCKPFEWDDSRCFDRGKVMSALELERAVTLAVQGRRRRRHSVAHAAGTTEQGHSSPAHDA